MHGSVYSRPLGRLLGTLTFVSMFLTSSLAARGQSQYDAEKTIIRFPNNESVLRKQLIAITPLGTSSTQVRAFLASEMRARGATDQSAIDASTTLRGGAALIPNPDAETRGWHYAPVGAKHITVIFKSRSIGFVLVIPVATQNVVEISYAFTTEDRLVDIGVSKWVEGLP